MADMQQVLSSPKPDAGTSGTPGIAAFLSAGDLQGAIDFAKAQVKASPSDAAARLLLSELCLIDGDLEKADTHADLAGLHKPEWATGLAVYRAHLRAMHARNRFFENCALPSFVGIPSEADRLSLQLTAALIADDRAEIAKATATRATLRLPDASFDGADIQAFAGLDERFPHAVELLMANGDYVLMDVANIDRLQFETVARPRARDLVFRKLRLTLTDGSGADCVTPAIYPFSAKDDLADTFKLGHQSDWTKQSGAYVGSGQICWLSGDEAIAAGDIGEVTFHAP